MDVLAQPNPEFLQVLGFNRLRRGQKRRFLKFCAIYESDLGIAIYNPMTRSLAMLSDDEFESIFNGSEEEYIDFLIRSYTIVAEDFEDVATMEKLRKHYEVPIDDKYLQGRNIDEYTILTTTHCNANCFYCYEKGRSKNHMTVETAEKIGEFIIEHSPFDRTIQLRWFGGEPLYNAKVIDTIVHKLKEVGLTYISTITSNASLFDEELVKKAVDLWHLQHVQVTIDGTEEVYNKAKNYTKKDFNAYQKVIENIGILLNNNVSVTVRMNLDLYNADNLLEVTEELTDYFKRYPNFGIYVYPIYEEYFPRTEEQKAQVYAKLEEIEDLLVERGYLIGKDLFDNIRTTHCMVDNGRAVLFAPTGEIGLCEHYSDSQFFSHIDNYEEKNWDLIKDWKRVEEPLDICEECCYFPDCLRCSNCVELRHCDEYIREWRKREVLRGLKRYVDDWGKQMNNGQCGSNGCGQNECSQDNCECKKEEPKTKWQAFKDNLKIIFNG